MNCCPEDSYNITSKKKKKFYSINRRTYRKHSSILNVIFIPVHPLEKGADSGTALYSIMEVLNPHAESVNGDVSHGYK